MKKRTCRKISIKEVDATALVDELGSGRAVFAIDVFNGLLAAVSDGGVTCGRGSR